MKKLLAACLICAFPFATAATSYGQTSFYEGKTHTHDRRLSRRRRL